MDKNVEGWFYPIDIIVSYGILNEIQKEINGDLCEIGVAYGKSAICLSEFRRPGDKLFLYDIFSEEVKNKAENNIGLFGNNKNLIWRIENTFNLKNEDIFFDKKLRFLHIDGCHEHSAVLNDLIMFSNHMNDSGVIVLDDYNDYEYPGVNSAAFEFTLSKNNFKNWRIFATGDNKAYLCQKQHQKFYQTKLIDFFIKSQTEYNVPFKLKMCLREMFDINILLCDSREDWDKNIIKDKLFDKPVIG